ncbi:hypothetical protein NG819_15470 [Pseudarthrobacter sp. Fe7]|nr:hypothetical protein NG819_15470 [Pseudarthrobacter sp. Fe7]
MGDGPGVGEFLPCPTGEVDAESGTDAAVVHGDADKAFLGPEAEGVPDEAEDIRWCFDCELFHDPVFPSPWLLLFHLRLLVVGVVLVGDHPLG